MDKKCDKNILVWAKDKNNRHLGQPCYVVIHLKERETEEVYLSILLSSSLFIFHLRGGLKGVCAL